MAKPPTIRATSKLRRALLRPAATRPLIDASPEIRSLLIHALGDHIRALESNKRRALRGQSIAVLQGDNATATAYEQVQATADRRIKRARAVHETLTHT